MLDKKREQWGPGSGFLLATLGSAVGIGNVWRFSYVAGENGGGADKRRRLMLARWCWGRGARGGCYRQSALNSCAKAIIYSSASGMPPACSSAFSSAIKVPKS